MNFWGYLQRWQTVRKREALYRELAARYADEVNGEHAAVFEDGRLVPFRERFERGLRKFCAEQYPMVAPVESRR